MLVEFDPKPPNSTCRIWDLVHYSVMAVLNRGDKLNPTASVGFGIWSIIVSWLYLTEVIN
jgi:hypothetical protein